MAKNKNLDQKIALVKSKNKYNSVLTVKLNNLGSVERIQNISKSSKQKLRLIKPMPIHRKIYSLYNYQGKLFKHSKAMFLLP